MQRTHRNIIAGLTMLAALALVSASATARTRITDDAGTGLITLTASRLTFAGSVNVICNITLSSSLHRLINKIHRELLGLVSEGRAGGCVNEFGQREPETAVRPLVPMHIQYGSITGTLPDRITGGVLLIEGGFLFRTNVLGRSGCLYAGAIPAIATENPVRRLTLGENASRLTRTLEGICPSEGELQGSFTSSRAIRIILLER